MQYDHAKLPLTNLHYVKTGQGEPLIMVPATISEIDNWSGLIQFFGQRFTTYFFDLPGHGQSSAFKDPFSSELVAKTLEDFIDYLGYEKINLMGFSFGGILALKTLEHLSNRIDRVILYAPCVSYKALNYSDTKIAVLQKICKPLLRDRSQKLLMKVFQDPRLIDFFIVILNRIGHVETNDCLKEKLIHMRPETVGVLAYQLNEILNSDFTNVWEKKSTVPCYFGMSVNDPLLDYSMTKQIVSNHFSDFAEAYFDMPYHQAPGKLTLEELNRDYSKLLSMIR